MHTQLAVHVDTWLCKAKILPSPFVLYVHNLPNARQVKLVDGLKLIFETNILRAPPVMR